MKYFIFILSSLTFISKTQETIQPQTEDTTPEQILLVKHYYKQLCQIEKNQPSLILKIVPQSSLERLTTNEIEKLGSLLAFCDWQRPIIKIDLFRNKKFWCKL
jgi:hypothetical protein